MKLRQSALQNKTFVDTIKQSTICMAGNDVAYNNLSGTLKAKGEFQFLKRSLSETPNGIHQGIYLLTPSGKLLKKINWGWPNPDTRKMNSQLDEGLAAYKRMSKAERLGGKSLSDNERSLPKKRFIVAPKSWLKLRNVSRSYAFQEMELFDIRNPVYNKIDKLWFTEKEKLTFVPSQLTKGTSEQISSKLLNRILTNSHLILGPAAWWDEHNKKAEMSMTVKAIKGDHVLIHYKGDFKQDADSKWNKSSYQGKLLGRAVWNKKTKAFTKFTWLALGDYTIKNLRSNMHRGNTKTVRIASKLELDPLYPSELDLTPFHWDEPNYRHMKKQLE